MDREVGSSYLKFLALPEVRPFSGRDKDYSWEAFQEAFTLKYPKQSWSDKELRALFRAKLTDKARAQYDALPRDVRHGPYEGIRQAMARAFREEVQTGRIVALTSLRKLRKTESQTVAEYCIELERLSARAYPELDEVALATTRAQQLYEQLVHWPESYHLLVAMESAGADAYANLKQAAMRMERRKLTLESAREAYGNKGRGFEKTQLARFGTHRAEPGAGPRTERTKEISRSNSQEVERRGEFVKCFRCQRTGHIARNCKNGGRRPVDSKATDVMDNGECAQKIGSNARSREGTSDRNVPSFGEKCVTDVVIKDRRWRALLDTGSEISIMPVGVYNHIKKLGAETKELPVDTSKRIFDASGNRMTFEAVADVALVEGGREATLRFHVSRQKGNTIVIGTNALPTLGYTLVMRGREQHTKLDKKSSDGGDQRKGEQARKNIAAQQERTKVVVCKRAYVAPGQTRTIAVQGQGPKEAMFLSSATCIQSGLCRVDEKGISCVRVQNNTEDPLVLRAGQEVGEFEDETEYDRINNKEVITDMLVLGKPALQEAERAQLLCDTCEEFKVADEQHFLHVTFRCYGQPFPEFKGKPGFPLHTCRCSKELFVKDLLSAVPSPAAEERIECVLDAARVLTIWWGLGSISRKVQRILDREHLAVNTKAIGVAYAFFRAKCSHVLLMSALVPQNARLRHPLISGWPYDVTRIVEYGYEIGRKLDWTSAAPIATWADEHGRAVVVLPERKHTKIFANDVGRVILILPPQEPEDPYSWIPFVAATDLWLTCGAHLWIVNGPRSVENASWDRMNETARLHVLGYMDGHSQFVPQLHDLIPAEPGVLLSSMACLKVGVVKDPRKWLTPGQALEFYEFLRAQLDGVDLEPVKLPRGLQETLAGKPSGRPGQPAHKDGRISKRHLKRVEKRRQRSEQRRLEHGVKVCSL
ncbi:unnamed protein product [Nippostrongylus brasiliensis]|uniref:CCHC-type domain-containing protein n=1 Tax=Nippostrongylus brasiliensis TaxID=27835 RepID=A0A0N4YR16_NIPBR|nr:unnamed protein product [Nippostrongylus brasiliensis]